MNVNEIIKMAKNVDDLRTSMDWLSTGGMSKLKDKDFVRFIKGLYKFSKEAKTIYDKYNNGENK